MSRRPRLRLVHSDPIVEMSVRIPRSMRDRLEQLAVEQYAIDLNSYVRSWLSSAISCDTQHARDRTQHLNERSGAPRSVTIFRRRPARLSKRREH